MADQAQPHADVGAVPFTPAASLDPRMNQHFLYRQ
jgi:hypothetical protein